MDADVPVSIVIDAVVIVSSGTLLLCVKRLCRRQLYPFIATRCVGLDNDKLAWHFSKQLWGLTLHSLVLLWMCIVLIPTTFWPAIVNPYGGTASLWNEHSLPPLSIRLLYLSQIGYYAADAMYMFFWDRPSDVVPMSLHHAASLSLLLLSYLPSDCWKIGCAILLMHDIGDVSLYLCKTLHYAQLQALANALFVVHIAVWIWSRLLWFPRLIVSLYVVPAPGVWQVVPCSVLLWTLFVLHAYWTWLMLRVLYKAVVHKELIKDARDGDVVEVMAKDTKDERDDNEIDLERTDVVIDVHVSPKTEVSGHRRRRSSLVGSLIELERNVIVDAVNEDESGAA